MDTLIFMQQQCCEKLVHLKQKTHTKYKHRYTHTNIFPVGLATGKYFTHQHASEAITECFCSEDVKRYLNIKSTTSTAWIREVTQQTCSRAEDTLPDAPGVRPVSGHKGTCQQRRDRFVKQEVVLKVGGTQGGGGRNQTEEEKDCGEEMSGGE